MPKLKSAALLLFFGIAFSLGIGMLISISEGTDLFPKPVDLRHPVNGVLETRTFHIGPDAQVLNSVQSGRHGTKYAYVRLVETDNAVLLNGVEGSDYVCRDLLNSVVQANRLNAYNLREMDRKLIAYRGQTIKATVLVPTFSTAPKLCDGMRWDPSSKEVYLGSKVVYFFAPSGAGYAGTLDSWQESN
ncbi:hypothetical protein [Paraburkholderia sp. A3RO-2L]|jgi:hypothetical protein|uniref:hypothetical protein n=1 Tax=unclassified Paraburkholderia TaxID=2615204 RepID=UPI003DA8DEE1